jgi:hypothetical protein
VIKPSTQRVLIVGVYLLEQANYAAEITRSLTRSKEWKVDIKWAAVGHGTIPEALASVTSLTTTEKSPKFALLNRLLALENLDDYRYLVVIDDDIELPKDFLDTYLGLQSHYNLALAQPARTHDSFIDHHFVAQLLGVAARRTRFVEIGPLFSISCAAIPLLVPFEEAAPMGWGLDFVWPLLLENAGLNLGIVDATSVRHALRKPVSLYDYGDTKSSMTTFLRDHRHLTPSEAFTALQTFPCTEDQGPIAREKL